MKQVAIVGIQGVPAKYGGFETLVENIIGKNCSGDIRYTVFCSRRDCQKHAKEYKHARLKYIPLLHANGIQSIAYDILSMLCTPGRYDTVLVLGVSGCIFLPFYRLLYRKRLIINIDGLEHRRSKWGKFTKKFLRASEAMAVKFADVIIADNKGIQDYVWETYHKKAELVAYGGDHALREVSHEMQTNILNKYGLKDGNYSISVCRIEPENNSHIILDAFSKTNEILLFIGNWQKSEYGRKLKLKYKNHSNIQMLNSIYDLDVLYTLRCHCKQYIHGHSAGGTNPSLVEAMHFGKPILAYDVVYNRETTENRAYYFKNVYDLISLILQDKKGGKSMSEIAHRKYFWKRIAEQYEVLY